MREIRKFILPDLGDTVLAQLRPRRPSVAGEGRRPTAWIEEDAFAYFDGHVPVDQEGTFLCFPTRSHHTRQNYHAIALVDLDVLTSVALLNFCTPSENDPNAELHGNVRRTLYEGLAILRPNFILGPEARACTPGTLQLLSEQGYSPGEDHIEPETVCYLGTFPNRESALAVGSNAAVVVDNIRARERSLLDRDYVGPIYVSREITRNPPHRTFLGQALPFISDASLRKRIFDTNCTQAAETDTPLQRLIRHTLENDPL